MCEHVFLACRGVFKELKERMDVAKNNNDENSLSILVGETKEKFAEVSTDEIKRSNL